MSFWDIDTSSWDATSDIIATLNKIKANFTSIKATTINDLDCAAKGANSDITSLSGLTTALSVSQGGTGATDAATARVNLGIEAQSAQMNPIVASLVFGRGK